MTAGTVKTQGTELFLADASSSAGPTPLKLSCPTGITGLGGPADQITTTCLDSEEHEYERGMRNPGQVNVPFNFIPVSESQRTIFDDLAVSGETIEWLVGLSDGTAVPTLDGDGLFIAPADRTSATFSAYVADVNLDIATNDIIRGTMILQRSGPIVWTWRT